MKIHVLAFDEFIWTNQIRVNGESARASFDWLQEGGPASPLRLQISVSARIVPKLQAQKKERRSFLHIQIGSTRSIRFAVL